MSTRRRIVTGAVAAAATLLLVGVDGGTRVSASNAEFWVEGERACGSDVVTWTFRRAENFPLLENETFELGQTYLGRLNDQFMTEWTPVSVDGISPGPIDPLLPTPMTGTSSTLDAPTVWVGLEYTVSYGGPIDDPDATRIEWANFASNTVRVQTNCPAPTPAGPRDVPPIEPPGLPPVVWPDDQPPVPQTPVVERPPVVEAPLDPPLASTTTVPAAVTSTTAVGTPGVVTASATGNTSPAGVTPVVQSPVVQSPVVQQLPSTGSDTPTIALAAALALLSGGALVAASRRR